MVSLIESIKNLSLHDSISCSEINIDISDNTIVTSDIRDDIVSKKKLLENEYVKLRKKELTVFGVKIFPKISLKSNLFSTKIIPPLNWSQGEQFEYNKEKDNGLAILMGKKNGIIGLCIHNINDWTLLLSTANQLEPYTVKFQSSNGDIYYFFNYVDTLKSNLKSFICNEQKLSIEIKTNGDFLLLPTSYYYDHLNNIVTYSWINSIYNTDIIDLPSWILNYMFDKCTSKEKKLKKKDIYLILTCLIH